ncbi:hypothetical protein NLD30_04430 [SCandidatus Aminicenantes bacterium Aminicenantia_JdfR_composite]|nr:hypothetical protein [SCandidatus Aminicenantes bacterium Aminicenantia_JdfR_composite]
MVIKRIRVNLQPNIPNSRGILLTANKDHSVTKATIVPILAPQRRSVRAMGKLI